MKVTVISNIVVTLGTYPNNQEKWLKIKMNKTIQPTAIQKFASVFKIIPDMKKDLLSLSVQ